MGESGVGLTPIAVDGAVGGGEAELTVVNANPPIALTSTALAMRFPHRRPLVFVLIYESSLQTSMRGR
jgi:hypothetical protein